MAGKRFHSIAALMLGVARIASNSCIWAKEDPAHAIDLPAQALDQSLRAVAADAGWELYMPAELVSDVSAAPLRGTFSTRDAVNQLLAQTGLKAQFLDDAVIISAEPGTDGPNRKPIITVTGSRIAGAAPAAPVRVITAEDMRRGGQADLGEVIRFWLTNTVPLADAATPAAKARGRERWEHFVEVLTRKMELGPRVGAEISRSAGTDEAQ